MKTLRAILLLLLIGAAGGCGSSSSPAPAPTPNPTPTPTPTPQAPVIAQFNEPGTTFTTPDIRDVDEQIVQFDTANNALIWKADGRSFPGYPVSGLFIRADRAFQVRFGTKDGERRAYFTETVATTICDIQIVNGVLTILPTNVPVPGGG
jgi:hypothetical protein